MLNLRPYQLEALEAIWSEISVENEALCSMSTGAGKTEVAIGLVQKAIEVKSDIRIVMLMDRIDLVSQTAKRFSRVLGPQKIGVWCGSLQRRELSRQVTIASVQSADVRKFPAISLVIIDEVHLMNQSGSAYTKFIEHARDLNPRVKIVGLSATPYRADGVIYGEDKFFKRICYRKGIQELIDMGFLCRPILKQGENAFDTSALRIRAGEYRQEDIDELVSDEISCEAQVREALHKMSGRQCVAWATANIEHCSRVVDLLMNMGERATSVHSKQNRSTRDANLSAFMGGSCRHMVFVSVLSTGFDFPPIDCIVLMRPTRSPVLYVQTCGRGLRISEGKKDCLVLDYGQVVRELGPLDDPKVKGKKGTGEAVMKVCPSCASWVPGGCRNCPDCQHEFPPPAPPEQKLSRKSDGDAKILSEAPAPEKLEVGPARLAMHRSKSGNECVKVTYQDSNILNRWQEYDGVREYFVVTSPWAMERLERRLSDIGARLPGIPFDGEIVVEGTFELVKTRDGKYDRVQSVKRISATSPERGVKGTGTYLDNSDWMSRHEDDTSFDFGRNVKNSINNIDF